MSNTFTPEKIAYALDLLKSEIPFAIWETFYVTVIATLFAFVLPPLSQFFCMLFAVPTEAVTAALVVIRAEDVLISGFEFGIFTALFFLAAYIVSGHVNIRPSLRAVAVGTTIGSVASIVPLVIAAFPFVARLVESSLREVNPNIIEAALSMGATPFQIITKVMIPESVPSLISNAAIAVTTILGYTAMSGAIGGGGLGNIAIMIGYNRYNYLVIIETVVLLIVMVQIFQSLGTFLSRKSDKRLK